MEIISMGLIKTTIFFLILLYASIKDIKTREVSDFIPIMICITALINNSVQNIPYMIIGAIFISIPQIIIAAMNPGTYGGADIKIVAACTFFFGIINGLIVLILGILVLVILNKIHNITQKNKNTSNYPMIPLFYFACITRYCLLLYFN